jgi:phosphoesterase RecJ-like protein
MQLTDRKLARQIPEVDEILRSIHGGSFALVTTHARCDGDAIGSLLAFGRFLGKLGKKVDMVVDDPVPSQYGFLPGVELVRIGPESVGTGYDLVVALDSASLDRLEGIADALPHGVPVVNIDHHGSNSRFGTVNWVDVESAAVGEMIFDIVARREELFDYDIALNLYVSIATDTGRFSFSSTTSRSHRIAAELMRFGLKPSEVSRHVYADKTIGELSLHTKCLATMQFSPDGRIAWARLTRDMYERTGSKPRDSQEYVEAVKAVRGVEVAILFRETEQQGQVKASFRATGVLNAAEIAALFGGGGHARSSGASIEGNAEEAEKRVLPEVMRYAQAHPRQ